MSSGRNVAIKGIEGSTDLGLEVYKYDEEMYMEVDGIFMLMHNM